jgi:insulysin
VSKFTTGNNLTLPSSSDAELVKLREALLAFHAFHYAPENLIVTMAGPQDLDTLQEWAVSRWSAMSESSFSKYSPEVQSLIRTAAEEAPDQPVGGSDEEPAFNPPLLSASQLLLGGAKGPLLLTTKPIQPLRQMVLLWSLPSVQHIPDNSPLSLLGHLLGHEGPSSIFAHLQNEGLVSALSAGPRMTGPDFSIFQVSIQLTEAGEERWSYVARTVLQYLQVLVHSLDAAVGGSSTELHNWRRIWTEKVQLSTMHFEYQSSPGSVYDYSSSLCHAVKQYGTPNCLSAGSMLDQKEDTNGEGLPLQRMQDCVHRLLRPENLLVERSSTAAWEEMEELEATLQKEASDSTLTQTLERRKERWYGVEFFISTVDPKDEELDELLGLEELGSLASTDAPLDLPRPNTYIPQSFELCADLPDEIRAKSMPRIDREISPPKLLLNDAERGRLWHRLDDRYSLPKAYLTLSLVNAAVQNVRSDGGSWEFSPQASVSSSILSRMFSQAMSQDTYDADLAGLYWGVSLSSSGIRFSYSGFHDRLPDLSLDILRAFASRAPDSWVRQERFFKAAQDKLLRNLRTFFTSRRADAHANYYRDLLLEDQQASLEASIAAAESLTLDDAIQHHEAILMNESVFVDSLSMGNLSEEQTKTFFTEATDFLLKTRSGKPLADGSLWRPSISEVRLSPGEDIEIHFASENPQEENGAVLVTYQSPIPGYAGPALSTTESLHSTACLRLLSQILREPIFNELRTKQTLGYIVSSYYENGSSSRPATQSHLGPLTVPVDAFSIVVLSRKVSPPEVAQRINDFLDDFRGTLSNLPETEIHSHAQSLSTKLLKPIQKLGTEASTQFSKILRYAPQVLEESGPDEIPWNPVASRAVAAQLQTLNRSHLLATWDRMFSPGRRARVVSCVYGSTFPFKDHFPASRASAKSVLTSVSGILSCRQRMPVYDDSPTAQRRWWWPRASISTTATAAALIGVGALGLGWTIWSRRKSSPK